MILSKSTRSRILSVASWLDSMAAALRRWVKATTPRRNKTEAERSADLT
jgi:hypothetical protein